MTPRLTHGKYPEFEFYICLTKRKQVTGLASLMEGVDISFWFNLQNRPSVHEYVSLVPPRFRLAPCEDHPGELVNLVKNSRRE
jgi:hypothetical protein